MLAIPFYFRYILASLPFCFHPLLSPLSLSLSPFSVSNLQSFTPACVCAGRYDWPPEHATDASCTTGVQPLSRWTSAGRVAAGVHKSCCRKHTWLHLPCFVFPQDTTYGSFEFRRYLFELFPSSLPLLGPVVPSLPSLPRSLGVSACLPRISLVFLSPSSPSALLSEFPSFAWSSHHYLLLAGATVSASFSCRD